jgi:TusA-related sulfurtransferase
MEVLATDSGTLKDLPAWSKKMGHDFLGHYEDSGYLRLFLKKMK